MDLRKPTLQLHTITQEDECKMMSVHLTNKPLKDRQAAANTTQWLEEIASMKWKSVLFTKN